MAPNVLSVSQLTELIKLNIESDPRFQKCYVSGEIFNYKYHSSGHMYFTLKDEKSRIRAVMFAGRNRSLPFRPEDGMRVICTGNVSVFDRDGQYQLYIDDMQPDGVGALYVAFEQLRSKLAAEGLFDNARKRELPMFPKRIGVVTSPTGAVIRDICTTLERRYPLASVVLAPALVQGPGAAKTVVAGIRQLLELSTPVDVIIVGRGGGSLEELWPFNEELVARAIAECPIPIVSAVGHETDVTICDFVADVRAATPTAAAELVAPHISDLRYQLTQAAGRAGVSLRFRMTEAARRYRAVASSNVLQDPGRYVNRQRQTVDFLEGQLRRHIAVPVHKARGQLHSLNDRLFTTNPGRRLHAATLQVGKLEQQIQQIMERKQSSWERTLERMIVGLEALNPLSVLRRGYSITYQSDGLNPLVSASQVKPGDKLFIDFIDGRIQTKVLDEGVIDDGEQQLRLNI